MTEQLRPCPFCGMGDLYYHYPSGAYRCSACLATGPQSDSSPDESIPVAAWNRRSDSEGAAPSPSEAAVAAPVELLEMLKDIERVALARGDTYLFDQIDNDGHPYQSMHLAHLLAAQTKPLLAAQAVPINQGVRATDSGEAK